jgi:hypothetical protein
MNSALVISFLFGVVMGQRFTVLILVPTIAVVMLLPVGAALVHPHAAWWIIRMAGTAAVFLQCGYFTGLVWKHFFLPAPTEKSPSLASAETIHPPPRRLPKG